MGRVCGLTIHKGANKDAKKRFLMGWCSDCSSK